MHMHTCFCCFFFVFLLGVNGGRKLLLAVYRYFPLTSLVCAFSPTLKSSHHLWPFPPNTPLTETLTRSQTSLCFVWPHSILQNAHS